MRELCDQFGEEKVFTGDPARQLTADHFGHSAGALNPVTDLESALAALEEIVEQGEGTSRGEVWDGDHDIFHRDRDEVAHYFRFQELKLGRRYQRGDTPESGPTGEPVAVDYTGVQPVRPNSRLADHGLDSPIRQAQEEFNGIYCNLLQLLEQATNGEPSLLRTATGMMYQLKGKAQALMAMPDAEGYTAGPTFEYVEPELRA